MNHFTTHTPNFIEKDSFKEYAVMIPFYYHNYTWHLVYEQRSKTLRHQGGEICFPGGGIESGESPLMAACREMREELLIEPWQFGVWGSGDILLTPSFHMIHTIIGQIHTIPTSFQKAEVERLHIIPLKDLQKPSYTSYVQSTSIPVPTFPFEKIPRGKDYPWYRHQSPVYFYETKECTIWGMTAKMTKHSLSLVEKYRLLDF